MAERGNDHMVMHLGLEARKCSSVGKAYREEERTAKQKAPG
jgi:hypothetical protein